MKSSFTLIELLVVIIIIGIIVATLSFDFAPNKLQLAVDQIIKDIRFTQSLALKDDKYQPFPEDNSSTEQNRSKYWFKQWWQIRFFTNSQNDLFYEIFSDSSVNNNTFDTYANPVSEFATSPLTGKYMTANYSANTDEDLNLSKFNIKKIKYNIGNGLTEVSSNSSLRFLFDNYGNIFLDEGDTGDSGDINPLDFNKRPILKTIAKMQLCNTNSCDDKCVQINISASGNIYKSTCN